MVKNTDGEEGYKKTPVRRRWSRRMWATMEESKKKPRAAQGKE